MLLAGQPRCRCAALLCIVLGLGSTCTAGRQLRYSSPGDVLKVDDAAPAGGACKATTLKWRLPEVAQTTQEQKLDIPKVNDGTVPLWQGVDASSPGSPQAPDVVAAYAEVALLGKASDQPTEPALYTALGSSFATLGLLATPEGTNVVFRTKGGSSDAKLMDVGSSVDVRRTPAPEGPHGTTFRGLDAFSDIGNLAEGNRSIGFLLRLNAETDEYGTSAHTWHGWPRSLPVRLEGYFRTGKRDAWQLLASVRTHLVTNGVSNAGGFLGEVESSLEPLTAAGCASPAQARFGHARYVDARYDKWLSFPAADVPQGAVPTNEEYFVLHAGVAEEKSKSATKPLSSGSASSNALPSLLLDYPEPRADLRTLPKGLSKKDSELTHGREKQLAHWGLPFDRNKESSCVTPDYPAVQSDPLQAAPTGPPPDMTAFCPVLPAEHFHWHTPTQNQPGVEWFYNEITVDVTGPRTYFMATGFQGGYMGIQEHEDSSKRFALFSIWDGATKTEIVDWGEDVMVGRFGAEGTGANSHRPYAWEIGKPVRFLVHAEKEAPAEGKLVGSTLFTGFIHDDEQNVWRLMAKFRIRPCGVHAQAGGQLIGFNSFLEVFDPPPAQPNCSDYGQTRVARYGPAFYGTSGATDAKAFTVFPHVSLGATCGAAGCPKSGINFYEADTPGTGQTFVMTVGKTVKNDGNLPMFKPRPVVSRPPPQLLAAFPLPALDNSYAGEAPAGAQSGRHLSKWGEQQTLERWGSGGKHLECPWYVKDCAPSGYGHAYKRSP